MCDFNHLQITYNTLYNISSMWIIAFTVVAKYLMETP